MTRQPNQPAAGKAGITLCFDFGHHCPGLPEPGRSAGALSSLVDKSRQMA